MIKGETILFFLAGRLIIWLIQTNGFMRPLWDKHPLLSELQECDLCLGFWVYLVLVIATGEAVLSIWPIWLDYLAQAAAYSFVIHLIRIGWQSKFEITVV